MTILALDCALLTGWALQDTTKIIQSGTQDFTRRRGESTGMVFVRFNKWLAEVAQIGWNRPPVDSTAFKASLPCFVDLIDFEQAHHRGGAATEICVGMTSLIQAFAARLGINYQAVHSATIKKHALGKGNASKEDVMNWFYQKVGRRPVDDNEADAYALLKYAISTWETT